MTDTSIDEAGPATWHPLDNEGHAELRVNGTRITTFASYSAAEEAANRINSALAAPVRDETEIAIAALRGYQSAVSACLTAGGVPLNESGQPNSWWDDIIAAQQKGAAAIRALSQTSKPQGETP